VPLGFVGQKLHVRFDFPHVSFYAANVIAQLLYISVDPLDQQYQRYAVFIFFGRGRIDFRVEFLGADNGGGTRD
jgi:hypothetical protein